MTLVLKDQNRTAAAAVLGVGVSKDGTPVTRGESSVLLAAIPNAAETEHMPIHRDLSHNKLSSIQTSFLSHLQHLREVKLNNNELETIPNLGPVSANIRQLSLAGNSIDDIVPEHLEAFRSLEHLDLSNNNISELRAAFPPLQLKYLYINSNRVMSMEPGYFDNLASTLLVLKLNRNRISAVPPKMFKLPQLQHLDLKNNEISWTIEDMNGAFSGLDKLRQLILQGNRIRSITKKAFTGLDALEHLDLSDNAIMSLQSNAFSQMKKLQQLLQDLMVPAIFGNQTSDVGFGLPNEFLAIIYKVLRYSSTPYLTALSPGCTDSDDFPKPQITVQPETQSAIKGSNVSFICSAASSSDSPMTFAWKKDNELLPDAEMENYAHLRAQGGEVMEYTTILRLRGVEFASEGKYQCVISNHFGSSYSIKAKLTVNSM
ncbi:hypothetical protein STEG23_032204 [Scotinomys teguina]